MPNATRHPYRITDPSPYPILTQDADGAASGFSRPDGGGGTAGSPTRVAAEAIRQVLGWRYRSEDVKGFQNALTKSFTPRYVDGSPSAYDWNRLGAATVDDTELTGALASFYTRTKVAIDQAVPLLDTVRPLKPDADPEDTEATRAIVRDRLLSLPATLGAPGGPPPQRIDTLFLILLGYDPGACHGDPEKVGGELGTMRDRFGLVRSEVNTIEEELNLTNFQIVVDYVASLHQTWVAQRRYLGRDGKAEPYLGNQMVLIKNQLDVVADSVTRARMVMESVYFNVAEQQATFLHLGPDESPMTVAELLDWVVDATQLTPDQMQSKDSLAAFRVVFQQLHRLVAAALNQSQTNLNNSTRGFYTQRVQLALDSLQSSLNKALGLANQIHRGPRPTITGYQPDPPQLFVGGPPQTLRVLGTDFRPGVTVQINPTAQPEHTVSGQVAPTSDKKPAVLDVTFTIPRGPTGPWDLTVVNPDGQNDSALGAITVSRFPGNSGGGGGKNPGGPSTKNNNPAGGNPTTTSSKPSSGGSTTAKPSPGPTTA